MLVFWKPCNGSTEACVSSVVGVELQAYDQHLNMILGDVEETVTTVEIDEETYEELYKVNPPVPACKDNVGLDFGFSLWFLSCLVIFLSHLCVF